MDNGEKACTSKAECPKEGICKCETTQNWVTMNPKAKVRKTQNSNTCSRREMEMLKLYEARVASMNVKERNIKMYRLIVDSYVQSTKHYLPVSVFNDWFGGAGLMKLPGTGRSVRPQEETSSATNPSPESSQQVRQDTDSAGNGTTRYFCKGCKETIKANPTTRVTFLGDGNLVDGIMSNIFIAKVICRGCQANKTMDLAQQHMLCFNCDLKEEN